MLSKAERNIAFSATVSARALKMPGFSLAFFFHHDGINPHRIGTRSRLPSCSTTASIVAVGQMRREVAFRRCRNAQPIERDDLAPSQSVGEASAHVLVYSRGVKYPRKFITARERAQPNGYPIIYISPECTHYSRRGYDCFSCADDRDVSCCAYLAWAATGERGHNNGRCFCLRLLRGLFRCFRCRNVEQRSGSSGPH